MYIYTHTHTHTYMCVCVRACIYIYTYMYTYINIYTYIAQPETYSHGKFEVRTPVESRIGPKGGTVSDKIRVNS